MRSISAGVVATVAIYAVLVINFGRPTAAAVIETPGHYEDYDNYIRGLVFLASDPILVYGVLVPIDYTTSTYQSVAVVTSPTFGFLSATQTVHTPNIYPVVGQASHDRAVIVPAGHYLAALGRRMASIGSVPEISYMASTAHYTYINGLKTPINRAFLNTDPVTTPSLTAAIGTTSETTGLPPGRMNIQYDLSHDFVEADDSYSLDSRGISFVAPVDMTLTYVYVPEHLGSAGTEQTIQVIKSPDGISYEGFVTVADKKTIPAASSHVGYRVNVPLLAGDLVGIIGVRESEVFYATTSPYTLTVAGSVVSMDRLACSEDISTEILATTPTVQPGSPITPALQFAYRPAATWWVRNEMTTISSSSGIFRGFRFEALRNGVMTEIEGQFNPDVGDVVRFCIQEMVSGTGTGIYDEEAHASVDYEHWLSSGPMSVPLVAGSEYVVGYYLVSSVQYLYSTSGTQPTMSPYIDYLAGAQATPASTAKYTIPGTVNTVANRYGVGYTFYGAPDQVTNIQVASVTSNSLTLVWDVPFSETAIENYRVDVYDAPLPGGDLVDSLSPVGATTVVYTLTPETSYSVYVIAINVGGESEISSELVATTGSNAPTSLGFHTVPSSGSLGGSPLIVQPVVEMLDVYGDLATGTGTVSVSVSGGATITGNLDVAFAFNKASFSGVAVDEVGTYDLTFSSSEPGIADVEQSLTVTVGPADRLRFVSQPADGSPAAEGIAFTGEVIDAGGNRVTGVMGNMYSSVIAGPGDFIGGTDSGAIASGVTVFAPEVDVAGSGYVIRLSTDLSGVNPVDSVVFSVVPGTPTAILFETQPGGGLGGIAWDVPQQPVLVLKDGGGNTVTAPQVTHSATIAINTGTGALSGSTTVDFVGGKAKFLDLAIDFAGTKTLEATTTPASLTATSAPFSVAVGSPAALVFSTQPSSTGDGGSPLATQPVVHIVDAGGNTCGVSNRVDLTLSGGDPKGVASGTLSVFASGGIATFSGVSIDVASPAPYHLIALSTAGSFDATSNGILIGVGPPVALMFTTSPGGGAGGVPWPAGDQPVLTLVDAGGNTADDDTSTLLMTLETEPAGSPTLSGTNPVSFSNGNAAFSDLSLNVVGVYTLRATASPSGLFVISGDVSIGSGVPESLNFVTPFSASTGGVTFSPNPVVELLDTNLIRVTSGSHNVSVSIFNGTATSPSLLGTAWAMSSGGQASFPGLAIDKAGSFWIQVAVVDLAISAVSSEVMISVGPPATCAFATEPSGATGGLPFGQQPVVAVRDAGGNLVGDGIEVVLAKVLGPAQGQLLGDIDVDTVGGLATFTNVAIDVSSPVVDYVLQAQVAGAQPASSAALPVAAGVPAGLVFVNDAGAGLGGVNFSPQPVVDVVDAGGNPTGTGDTVSLTVETGPGSLVGEQSATDTLDGRAAFTGVALNTAGIYTLRATLDGMAITAVSPSITITPGSLKVLTWTSVAPSPGDVNATVVPSQAVDLRDRGLNLVTTSYTVTFELRRNAVGGGGPAGLVSVLGSVVTMPNTATVPSFAVSGAGNYSVFAQHAPSSTESIGPWFVVRGRPDAVDAAAIDVTATDTSLVLAWPEPFNGMAAMDGYNVTWTVGPSHNVTFGPVDVAAADRTVAVTGLASVTEVMFEIVSRNTLGYVSLAPAALTTSTVAGPPAPVGLVVITSVTTSAATLGFENPNNNGAPITSYTVLYSRDAGMVTGVLQTSAPYSASPTITLSAGLLSGNTYYVIVRAVNAVGASANSATFTFTLGVGAAALPTGLGATDVTADSIRIFWDPSNNPLEGVTHYNVGVGSTPDRFDLTNATVVVPTTEIVIDGLEPTTRYYYRIAAVNAVGSSPFTVALFEETAAGVPEAPVISLSGAGDGAAPAIAWDEPELNGATLQGYRVTVAGDAEFSGADGEFNDDLAATALDYDLDDPDLPVGDVYVRLVALAASGESEPSNTVEVAIAQGLFEGAFGGDGGKLALVIGIMVAGLAAMVAVVVGVWCCCCRGRGKYQNSRYADDATINIELDQQQSMGLKVRAMLNESSTKQIGGGGEADVYKAKLDGTWVALKVFKGNTAVAADQFHRAANILTRLNTVPHENVLQLRFFCEDPPALCLELCDSTLSDLLYNVKKRVEAGKRLDIATQVAVGLSFLHDHNIAHLDLKPSNILVADGFVLKICDFGVATSAKPGQFQTMKAFGGTPQFSAPERLEQRPIDLQLCDVYSYGVLLWSVYARRKPFHGEDMESVLTSIRSGGAPSKFMLVADGCDDEDDDGTGTSLDHSSRASTNGGGDGNGTAVEAPTKLARLQNRTVDPHPAVRPTMYDVCVALGADVEYRTVITDFGGSLMNPVFLSNGGLTEVPGTTTANTLSFSDVGTLGSGSAIASFPPPIPLRKQPGDLDSAV